MSALQSTQQNEAAHFFDRFAVTFDTFYDGKRGAGMRFLDHHFRRDVYIRYQLTFERLGRLEGKRVVDIGCGSGIYTLECLRRGAEHVWAVDPAPGMLALAQVRLQGVPARDRATLVPGIFPGAQLPCCNHAIVMGVMDYVGDAAGFLRGLHATISESAVVSFPSRHWFRTPIRKLRYRMRRCPVWFYDEEDICRLAGEAGFRGVEIVKIPGAGLDYHVHLCRDA